MTRQENKKLYLDLLNKVDSKIPADFIDKVKMARPSLKVSTIQNVRYGRSPKLEVLIFIIRTCVPAFMIPGKFLAEIEELEAVA